MVSPLLHNVRHTHCVAACTSSYVAMSLALHSAAWYAPKSCGVERTDPCKIHVAKHNARVMHTWCAVYVLGCLLHGLTEGYIIAWFLYLYATTLPTFTQALVFV